MQNWTMEWAGGASALPTFVLLASAIACDAGGSNAGYDPEWGTDAVLGGKADGLLEDAPQLSWSDGATGQVGPGELDVFTLNLNHTDTFVLTATVTSGNLQPHVTLYKGTTQHIRSNNYGFGAGVLTKEYTAPDSGFYTITVRPYRNRGSGAYTLDIACASGPCNNDPIPARSDLETDEWEFCMSSARQCAVAALPTYNGAVGPVRAGQILQGCLDATDVPGTHQGPCSKACDVNTDARDHCEHLESLLATMADASQECMDVFDTCWLQCEEYGVGAGIGGSGGATGGGATGIDTSIEALCLGTVIHYDQGCSRVFETFTSCGGAEDLDSYAGCDALCNMTENVWSDQYYCTEAECYDHCDAEITPCLNPCENETTPWDASVCVNECLEDKEVYYCDYDASDAEDDFPNL